MQNKNVMDMMEANAAASHKPVLKGIEVMHHMTDGSHESVQVTPHKMSEHMADCPHCSAGAAY